MTLKDLNELREQLKTKKADATKIVDLAVTDKREMTEKEEAEVKKLTEEARELEKKVDEALDCIEQEERKRDEKAQIEAEARREERFAQLKRATDVLRKRVVEDATRNSAEIRVHEAFPLSGRNAPAFAGVYGDEKRGRQEAYKAGMWLMGNVLGNEDARQWSRDYGYGAEGRALNNSANSAGAVLVPDGLVNAIIWNVEQRGIFAQYANVIPMGKNDVVFVPKSTGEVTVYAVAENQSSEVTESEPTFDGVELTARTWGALTRIGRNLIDDAVVNIAEHVAMKIGYAMADKQDQAGFNGDGTATYHNQTGVVTKVNDGNHAGSIFTAATGNTAFGTLDMDDFEACVGKLPQWAEGDDVAWYISKPGYYASMARLMDAAGGNTKDDVAGGKGLQFLGYPVRVSQVLNRTLTTQTDTIVALFGSLRKTAAFGQKKEVSVETLREKYATYNQIGLLAFSRWGINCHELGDGTNAGAMIALKTPGS